MSQEELRAAIIHPARAVGMDFEPGLVELLLRDLGADGTGYEAGRLPLLAHALRAAWQERHGSTLTVAGYQATGGIERAIAQTADQVHASLGPAERRAARSLFLRLVKIGDGTDDTRRRLSRTELVGTSDDPPVADAALAAFTAKRLCTSQQDTVEITHEALIHAWPRLRGWLDHDRAGLLVHQRLTEVASMWSREDRPSDALYRGVVLADAQLVAQRPGVVLAPAEREFLEASGRAQQRSTRRLRRLVSGLAVLLVLSLAASGAAVWSAVRADAEEREARSLQLAAQAQQLGEANSRAANLLALAAWHTAETPEARGAVLSSRSRPYRSTAKISDQPLSAVAVSDDSGLVAAAGEDGVVRLLLPNSAIPLRELHPGIGPIAALAFGLDDALVAVGAGGEGRLWASAYSDTSGLSFTTGHGRATSVAFDFGGRVFATAGEDGTVRRWALANGRQLGRPLTGHDGPVLDVAFQPCEGCWQLASSGRDGTVRRWDQASGEPIGEPLSAGGEIVRTVAYSTDGTVLAAGGVDQVVKLWDPVDGRQLDTLGDHGLPIYDLDFLDHDDCEPGGNSRGCLLATVSLDMSTRVWSVGRREEDTTSTLDAKLENQVSAPVSAAFAAGGRVLVTAHADGTIGWWSPDHDGVSTSGAVSDIAFPPDGRGEIAVDGRGVCCGTTPATARS